MILLSSESGFASAYALQTIRDNMLWLTPQLLDEINQIVVQAGHGLPPSPDLRTNIVPGHRQDVPLPGLLFANW